MSGPAQPIGADDPVAATAHGDRLRDAADGPVVVLVGVPGAGKSTVGAALAERLGVGFRDTDADVESGTGRVIADIFVESGEPEFRRLEAAAVATALTDHDGVLSLGGGAVTDAATRAALAGRPVVWLRVGLAAASQRAGLSGARPVLLGNVRAQMKALMDARAPLYTEVAQVIVDTDELTVDQTVEAILAGLGLQGATAQAPSAAAGASAVGVRSVAAGSPTPEVPIPDQGPPASGGLAATEAGPTLAAGASPGGRQSTDAAASIGGAGLSAGAPAESQAPA